MAEQKTDYLELLEGMSHGVLATDAGGRVVMCNPAAGRILGLEPERVLGKPFKQVFAQDIAQGSEFYRTLAGTLDKGKTIKGLVLPLQDSGEDQRHVWLDTSPLEQNGGLLVEFFDVTEKFMTWENERERSSRVTASNLSLQQDNQDLQSDFTRGRRWRYIAVVAVILLFAAAGFYVWDRTQIDNLLAREFGGAPRQTASQVRTFTVEPRPLDSTISLSGAIEPLETINVLSPFGGKILKKKFVYGQKVGKGHTLIHLDTQELEIKLRDAEVALIKAAENYKKLLNWSKSGTVIQAQRALIKAKNNLDETQQKLTETKMLFNKGIVPLDQYRSLQEQVTNQKLSLKTTEDQFLAAKRKGDKHYVRMARLQLENAKQKLAKLKRQIKMSKVQAPVVGVVVKPSAAQAKQAKAVEEGLQASEGQVLAALGNLEGLSVTTQVGELNVTKLNAGQKVLITSYAFPGLLLKGKIASVSSQAVRGASGQQPSFEVRITTGKLTGEQRKKLRLGMTANLQVQVFSAPHALVVPIAAVQNLGGGRYEVTLMGQDGKTRQTPVQTGMTTMSSVEITKGLKRGDKVVLPGLSGQTR
jgi:HlyD family secretion protein